MGSLRLLLAVAVVMAHSGVRQMVGGIFAVELFYMISGYLISFVLVESKTYKRLRDFYLNRSLRLFPLYWLVAILALSGQIVFWVTSKSSPFLTAYSQMPGLAAFFVGASNVTLLGQDQVMFMAVHGSQLQWTGNFQDSEVPLWNGLLVPQAWTLGVELSFYLVAPFLLRTKRRLLTGFLISLSLRVAFIYLGFGMVDPWRYRFFPTELCVFLLGAISHQFVRPKIDQISDQLKNRLGNIAVVIGVGFVAFFSSIPGDQNLKGALLFLFVIGALPLLFDFQNRSKFDNFAGQLSYPVYIWHRLVISCIGIMPVNVDHGTLGFFILTLVGSLALSWLSLRFLDRPIQKLRAKFRNRDFQVAPNGLAPLP